MHDTTLLAFRVESRVLTICRFRGVDLEYGRKRELLADTDSAVASTESFVRWALDRFSPSAIAVEVELPITARRNGLLAIIERETSGRGIPIRRVPRLDVFAAYGEPRLRTRAELRRVARGLWPDLERHGVGRGALDAAALGLLVQIRAELDALEMEGRSDAH